MKKEYIIKNADDIELLIKKGQFIKHGPFVVYYRKHQNETNRHFVFLVSKTCPTKVKRNYYKRILRTLTVQNMDQFSLDYDYAVLFRYQNPEISDFKKYEVFFKETLQKIKGRQQWKKTLKKQ